MKNDTITLALNGDNIPLSGFAGAIKYLQMLVDALSDEVATGVDIDWRISGLNTGSAIAEITGLALEAESVERVAYAYGIVGRSMAERKPIPYPDSVVTPAIEMTRLINGRITGIQFLYAGEAFTINESLADDIALQTMGKDEPGVIYSFGAITGVVDTLSRRSGFTFTLYDDIFDRAIVCHVTREQQEDLRGIWGKRVRVIGYIYREPETGKAQKVKNIQKIDILSSGEEGCYRHARGAVPWRPGDEPSETIIRRLRDVS